jgi:hypothetical protein
MINKATNDEPTAVNAAALADIILIQWYNEIIVSIALARESGYNKRS